MSVRYIIILVFSFLYCISYSQDGFIGKKIQIECSGLINTPLLSGSFSEGNFYKSGEELKERKDLIDFGGNLKFSIALSKRNSLGFNFIYRQNQVFLNRTISRGFTNSVIGIYNHTSSVHIESAQINHFSLLPILSIAPKGSYIGVGVSYDLGIGYTFCKLSNKGYYYSIAEDESQAHSDVDIYFLESKIPVIHGIKMQFGINLQVPITYAINFKVGMVSFLNLYYKPDFNKLPMTTEKVFNHENIFYNTQRDNLFNMNLNAGFVFNL